MLKATQIFKTYPTGDGQVDVLRGIDFEVEKGEIVAVVGPSGVGKSTLLHILGGLDDPSAGQVWIDETEVFALSDADRAHFRNKHVGFVFQFHHLLSDFTALENVMMPLLISGVSQDDARKPAEKLLDAVGLSQRMDHLPAELSGGEAQRVAVARALVAQPKVVLADEPSGNLDVGRSTDLHRIIWDLARSRGQTFVIATHDAELSKRADRVVQMADGHIV